MSLKIFIFTVYILQSIATWDNKVTRVCFINFEHIVYNVECKHFRIRHRRRSNRKRLFYSVASKPCENSSAIVKEEKKNGNFIEEHNFRRRTFWNFFVEHGQ